MSRGARASRGTGRLLAMLLALALALAGCALRDVGRQQQLLDQFCTITGTVEAANGDDAPLVVLLIRKDGQGPLTLDNVRLFDHFVRQGNGRWLFVASPGTYGLAAFEDRSNDLVYRPDEPFLRVAEDRLIACAEGETVKDIALVIPADGRPRFEGSLDVTAVQARSMDDQMEISLGLLTAVGQVAALDDPRFDADRGRDGLWRPFDFLFDVGPGVYFLEPFDAGREPVLFVHGIGGTPRDFQAMIDALDRRRFQAWVYYYPSGVGLASAAAHLDQTIMKLERQLAFPRLAVVAHSIGGLVARSFILKHHEAQGPAAIPLFVSIATPWDGNAAAGFGVEHAPVVVRSWRDIAPGSAFLTRLFYADATPAAAPAAAKAAGGSDGRRRLPEPVAQHLLFAFQRNRVSFGPSDDTVISVSSQTRWEAQEEARRLYGFDDTHAGVLGSDRAITLVNGLLAAAMR